MIGDVVETSVKTNLLIYDFLKPLNTKEYNRNINRNHLELRRVPATGKYFFPDNDYVRQVDHIRGY